MGDTREVVNNVLQRISRRIYKGGNISELNIEICELAIELLNALGHPHSNIFSDLQLEAPRRVRLHYGNKFVYFDAFVGRSKTAPPYVALVVDFTFGPEDTPDEPFVLSDPFAHDLLSFDVTSKAEYTLLFSGQFFAILGEEYPPTAYPLDDIKDEAIEALIENLSYPEEYPEGIGGKFPPGHHPNQTKLTRWLFSDSEISPEYRSTISTHFFTLDIDDYSELLYEAYSANSSQEKGETLEAVAAMLFEGLEMINIRDRNLRTRSGEIDLVLEYDRIETQNAFEYQSRYILVECKNTGDSVSSKEVGHFEKKLRESNTDLGVLITWNGISGESSGDDAKRYLDSSDADDPTILVITSQDLYSIMDGKSLYEIIDEKLYARRFDLPS